MPRWVLVRDNATVEELEDALTRVRAKQRLACIESTRTDIGKDIDELLELRAARLLADNAETVS